MSAVYEPLPGTLLTRFKGRLVMLSKEEDVAVAYVGGFMVMTYRVGQVLAWDRQNQTYAKIDEKSMN